MLKALLVISSLVFCAGALFAPPPTARDAAEWSGVVLRTAKSLGGSALSLVLGALPSSSDVVRYGKTTRLFAENAISHLREPKAPAPPKTQASTATPECRLREPDELLQQDSEQMARAWISHDDIECPPEAELPRPWCDPRVQAVLRLLEEDRVRRGESASPLVCEGRP
jgi:hypothetical protein